MTFSEEKVSLFLQWGHLPPYFFMMSCGDLRISPSYSRYSQSEHFTVCGILSTLIFG